ncbi:MAG: indole-3-glycerol phosphate synthase TrpC [Nitrospirae bacterium]|nr:indole-3-glycerol phosphate synthase TrpC [Nitrospirota bacterium]MBI5695800.1 indole-3-glycerol phosphate synthase TrpC [Nitrospirota bacterium]
MKYDLILDRIVSDKKEELKDVKAALPFAELKARVRDKKSTRDFAAALIKPNGVSIIAEVKKASPSKGIIRADFDPVAIATAYEKNGARAISVLTERRYFMGELAFLRDIRERVDIPLLRKDFIFEEYQVYEARANGADAFLLIATMLDKNLMSDLYMLGRDLGLDTLAEVHDEADLDKVLEIGFDVIGINNRNLKTFVVDIKTTGRLIEDIPYDRTVVGESGISTADDMLYLKSVGADAALIGESIMRERDFAAKLRELAGSDMES